MVFQILIPTYNRSGDLKKNLEKIWDQIQIHNLSAEVGVAISDNASTDDTWEMLQKFKKELNGSCQLDLLRNEVNVGLEQNVVNLLIFASADYIIWLGDDDFLPDGYIMFIRNQFAQNQTGWIIPGLLGVDQEGTKTIGRPVIYHYKLFEAGFDTVYELSHLAHQMSGLVVKRAGLYEQYMANPNWRNPYLFIFFAAYCQLNYNGIYAPSYQTIVNNFNPKAWGYNKVGLLDEVFKSYYYLKPIIGKAKLNKLLFRFLIMHSYRFEFEKGIGYVLKQGNWLLNSTNEITGIKYPLYKFLFKEYLVRKLKSFKN